MSGRDDEPAEPASPPCFLHEIDPAWSGLEAAPAAPDAGCRLCRIAAGEAPAHLVAEDAEIVAFVEAAPIRRGHVRIAPKAHHAGFDDLPPALAARMLHLGQRLARAQKALWGVAGVGFAFGGEGGHVHADVVPLNDPADATPEARSAAVAAALSGALRRA